MALKWGFACAGRIAHDYMNAITTLNESEHQIVAIADPFFVQAKSLAEQFQIPKAYDNFLELAQDPNVELVHVGSLNPQHFEIAMLMLQHGKHVLVQKPMCMNEKQAQISHDFVNSLGTLSGNDHQVVAVAARDLSRAEEFAKRFDVPKAYGSYLELAKDSNVEVVYIGTLNTTHCEVALLMPEHGKHVLVEKPMCMNEKQVQKLITCAKQKNVFLMEGLWSNFFPSYQYIRKQIESGKLGEIERVEAEYGNRDMGAVDRITKKDLGGGTILDVGVYTILFCQWIFQQEPKTIKATGILNDDGIDLEMSADLDYGNNKKASMKTSAIYTPSNTAKIIGKKGTITVPVLNCPTMIIDVDGSEKTFPPFPKAKLEFNFTNTCGLRYEAEEVRKCIRAGMKECEFATHNDSLTIARVEDEIRRQIGVKYPADDE